MSIGDVNSTERGSGARYNDGKPPIDLIPIRLIAAQWAHEGDVSEDIVNAMFSLAEFQEGGSDDCLHSLITELDNPWESCARVFEYGKRKYAAWNWSKGMQWSVPIGCAARHLMAVADGFELDHESGLPHIGHVMCNVVMLLTYTTTFPEGDDRPTTLNFLEALEWPFGNVPELPQPVHTAECATNNVPSGACDCGAVV